MHSARIYEVCKCHLVNITEALVHRVGYQLQNQRLVDRNKTIYRVVDDLANWRHCCCFVKGRTAKIQTLLLKSYF